MYRVHVSKNDTDVALGRSTNFNYFWHRCWWESMLSNGDVLSYLS